MPGVSEKPQPGEDGRFHCPRCEDVAYELPQHLGLHLYHKHGIAGKSRQHKAGKLGRPAKLASKSLAVMRRPKNPDITPDTVCMTVLGELAPNGSIPIHTLPVYTRWLAATGEMMEALE